MGAAAIEGHLAGARHTLAREGTSWCARASAIAALIAEGDNSMPLTHGDGAVDRKRRAMVGTAVMSCRNRTAGPAAARA
jgi:hypothetical protein